MVIIMRTGRERAGIGGQQHLEAQHGIERDVEQQAGKHGGDRRRALGMGVGQPGVQGRQPHLGAVAHEQEDEGEIEQRRIEAAGLVDDGGPGHGLHAAAHHRLGGEIHEDGAEEGERDADAAEDEIFPGRLDRFPRAIEARSSARWSASPLPPPPT